MARAALREPDLPTAWLAVPARQVQLLVDHRGDLVAERTRVISRSRWHLHQLDPAFTPPARSLSRAKHLAATAMVVDRFDGIEARLAGQLVQRCGELNGQIVQLEVELKRHIDRCAPRVPGGRRLRCAHRGQAAW